MIEYGDNVHTSGVFDPPEATWQRGQGGDSGPTWTFNSLPNPEVLNRTAFARVGQLLGGTSAVNGQFFDRPSRWDFEAWNKLQKPENDARGPQWDWDGIYEYFKKAGYWFIVQGTILLYAPTVCGEDMGSKTEITHLLISLYNLKERHIHRTTH